jgi:hypothetical protein
MVLARGAKGAGALVVGASDSNQGEQQPAVDGSDEDEAASVEVRRASHRLSSCPVHTCGGDAPTSPRHENNWREFLGGFCVLEEAEEARVRPGRPVLRLLSGLCCSLV